MKKIGINEIMEELKNEENLLFGEKIENFKTRFGCGVDSSATGTKNIAYFSFYKKC